jgi:hypothetical protein
MAGSEVRRRCSGLVGIGQHCTAQYRPLESQLQGWRRNDKQAGTACQISVPGVEGFGVSDRQRSSEQKQLSDNPETPDPGTVSPCAVSQINANNP